MKQPTTEMEERLLQILSAPCLFDGLTTAEERKERVRSCIINRGLEHAIAGRHTEPGWKSETFAERFERIYSEPLTAPRETKRKLA